jgi:hypothetical protein
MDIPMEEAYLPWYVQRKMRGSSERGRAAICLLPDEIAGRRPTQRHQRSGARLFRGIAAPTHNGIAKNETWTDEDLDALRAEIEQVRKDRRQS